VAFTPDKIDNEIKEEFKKLYSKFRKCVLLREKYMVMSLQQEDENPINGPDWNIYPAPVDIIAHKEYAKRPTSHTSKQEFDASKVDIPGAHPVCSNLMMVTTFQLKTFS
jgi:hypothetical protein